MADHAVSDIVTLRVERLRRWLPQLVNAVAAIGGLTPAELVAPGRTGWPVRLRAAIAIAAVDVMHKKWAEIGRALGGRNHGSIITAYHHGQKRLQSDPEFRQLTDRVVAIARAIAGEQLTDGRDEQEPLP